MIKTFLNTSENLFLDENGNFWRGGTPELTIRGNEEITIDLVIASPDYGTEAAAPDNWPADTSWSEKNGISAMLTVDSDYKHRIKGVLDAELASGTSELTVVFSGISNFDELPASGIVTVYSTSGAGESIGYSSRSVSGNKVTLNLDTAAAGSYAAGAVADVKQSPLCLAYLSTAKSDWANGHLVFDLAVDSARLRSLTEYSDTAKVNIDGIELLLYTVNSDNTVSLLRRFLWDSASLVNTLGDPGFPAPLPDAQKNYIAEEIARQLASSGGGTGTGSVSASQAIAYSLIFG